MLSPPPESDDRCEAKKSFRVRCASLSVAAFIPVLLGHVAMQAIKQSTSRFSLEFRMFSQLLERKSARTMNHVTHLSLWSSFRRRRCADDRSGQARSAGDQAWRREKIMGVGVPRCAWSKKICTRRSPWSRDIPEKRSWWLRVQIFLDQARRGRPTHFLRCATLDPRPADRARGPGMA